MLVYVLKQHSHHSAHRSSQVLDVWKVGAVGYHIEAVMLYHPELIDVQGNLAVFAIPITNACAFTLPKLAVLALFLRIFPTKGVRYSCYATGTILILAWIINEFTLIFQCTPRAKLWNHSLPGHCNNVEAHIRYASVPNIFTDVVMLIIPIPPVLRLHAPLKTKIAILSTFAIGSL